MFEKFDPWFEKCEHLDNRLMNVSQNITNWWTYRTGRSNLDFAYLFAVAGFATLGAAAADLLNMSDPLSSMWFGPLLIVDFILYGAILHGLMKLEEMLKPTSKRPAMNPLQGPKPGGICRIASLCWLVIVVLYSIHEYVFGTGVRWQVVAWALSLSFLSYFASCTPPPYWPQQSKARRIAAA